MAIIKLPQEHCEFSVVKCCGRLQGKHFLSPYSGSRWVPFSTDHSEREHTLKSLVLRKCVICISDFTGHHELLPATRLLLMRLSSILWVGDGRNPSICQIYNTSSADLVILFLPSSGCSPSGERVMIKAVALPPLAALSEIRIYAAVGRCIHS